MYDCSFSYYYWVPQWKAPFTHVWSLSSGPIWTLFSFFFLYDMGYIRWWSTWWISIVYFRYIVTKLVFYILLFVISFTVCAPISTGSERPGPCLTTHWFWGPDTVWSRSWDISKGLYTTTVSDSFVYRSGRLNTICRQRRANSVVPVAKFWNYVIKNKSWWVLILFTRSVQADLCSSIHG